MCSVTASPAQSRRLYSLGLPNPYNWAFDYHRFIQVGGWLAGLLGGQFSV